MLYSHIGSILFFNYEHHKYLLFIVYRSRGRIQDFKLGGGALEKNAPSGGRHEHFWGISFEKSRFYAQKIIFFPILGGGVPHPPTPPGSAPEIYMSLFVN